MDSELTSIAGSSWSRAPSSRAFGLEDVPSLWGAGHTWPSWLTPGMPNTSAWSMLPCRISSGRIRPPSKGKFAALPEAVPACAVPFPLVETAAPADALHELVDLVACHMSHSWRDDGS